MTKSQSARRRTRLLVNIEGAIESAPSPGHSIVLTLTTAANLSLDDFHNLRSSFYNKCLAPHIGVPRLDGTLGLVGASVTELQERGATHEHACFNTPWDVGAGAVWGKRWSKRRGKFVFVQFRQSKTQALVDLQQWVMGEWERHCRAHYASGRGPDGLPWPPDRKISNAHCQPIRTSAGATASYLANYLASGEERCPELKGRRLYRTYGAVWIRGKDGKRAYRSPARCRGNFSHYAFRTSDGEYRKCLFGALFRGRVAVFASEFGCFTLAELVSHLGRSALYEHREVIGRMALPETFDFPSEKARLFETNLRQCRRLSNRQVIEAGGLVVRRYRPPVPIVVFSSIPGEKFWSGNPDLSWDGKPDSGRNGELFPDRVVAISPGEAAIRAEASARARADRLALLRRASYVEEIKSRILG